MDIAVVYYSRTGNTEEVVKTFCKVLKSYNLHVDVFKVKPLKEYSPPLHLNLRLIIDTLIRRGTPILLEPKDFNPERYNIVVVATPVWFNNVASPIQQFLKSYVDKVKQLIVITTSGLRVNCNNILKKVKTAVKPVLCIDIAAPDLSDKASLEKIVQEVAKKILSCKT